MKTTKVIFKSPSPYKITLFQYLNNPIIYAYFSLNKETYRFSTDKKDIDSALDVAITKYIRIRRKGKSSKIPKFSQILNDFLKEKSKHLKPKTLINYKLYIKMLGNYFKNVEDITPKNLSEYDTWRRKQIKYDFKGDVVINREMIFLCNILKWSKNFYQIKIIIPKITLYKENKRLDIPTPKEMERILSWFCDNEQIFHYQLISFLCETGIRPPSEYQKLKWEDVDINKQIIIIRDRKSIHKDDAIPISLKAKEILEYFNEKRNGNSYVFGRDRTPSLIKSAWNNAIKSLKLNPNYTLYSTRHFFASRMILKGTPTKIVSTLMGHKTTKMVETRYSHLLCEDIRAFL